MPRLSLPGLYYALPRPLLQAHYSLDRPYSNLAMIVYTDVQLLRDQGPRGTYLATEGVST